MKKRNELKKILEGKFYGEDMENIYIEKAELDVFILTNELMALTAEGNSLQGSMQALGDGEEDLAESKRLDELYAEEAGRDADGLPLGP